MPEKQRAVNRKEIIVNTYASNSGEPYFIKISTAIFKETN